ncbi:DUF3135 domain-containing protein [Rheinheimera sp. YQF-2]|uniref:DUF3135 domain-containing protein n=1 Tax=Rheinheimera lutimaris TaxID=2740584 RepID=A0A7Y5APF0_9GAMM|nr:DUF3135 domain-containing protein [Rheinheimera lutimaris]
MFELQEYNFTDFNQLIQLCKQYPEKAELLRQQLIERQSNDANRRSLLQYQFVTEQRLKLLTSAEAKQLFIQQQLAQNIKRLQICLTELEQRCKNVTNLVQK